MGGDPVKFNWRINIPKFWHSKANVELAFI